MKTRATITNYCSFQERPLPVAVKLVQPDGTVPAPLPQKPQAWSLRCQPEIFFDDTCAHDCARVVQAARTWLDGAPAGFERRVSLWKLCPQVHIGHHVVGETPRGRNDADVEDSRTPSGVPSARWPAPPPANPSGTFSLAVPEPPAAE